MYNWLHDILKYLFLVKPTCFTALELAAFFYANKIPFDTAIELFQECNNPQTKEINLFRMKYERWLECVAQDHIYTYYNISIELMVFINESHYNECELASNDLEYIAIGFGDSFPDSLKEEWRICRVWNEKTHSYRKTG